MEQCRKNVERRVERGKAGLMAIKNKAAWSIKKNIHVKALINVGR